MGRDLDGSQGCSRRNALVSGEMTGLARSHHKSLVYCMQWGALTRLKLELDNCGECGVLSGL